MQPQIGFIGAGQMATALAQGFIKAGLAAAAAVIASDPVADTRQRFTQVTGGQTTTNNVEAAAASILFLAVKPQQMPAVCADLKGKIGTDTLVVSIAAGIRLSALADGLGPQVRLVRVMPNTPCLVGMGACGYCLGPHATTADGQQVKRLLEAVGNAYLVDEKLMDAVTGLSGSGPAFVYLMIEALSDAGVRVGLPRAVAAALAAQTVRGAAEMVLVTGEHPAVLKDRVASPGGTTIAGLQSLEVGGVRAALYAAVEAATRRSQELGG
jgi:pyrroline-5-carboxylate reductase